MPANKKYLTASPWERLAKLCAGILGGYLITTLLHMLFMQWWDAPAMLFTLEYAGFILWAILLILAFLAKNGYKLLLTYLILCGLLFSLVYAGKSGIL